VGERRSRARTELEQHIGKPVTLLAPPGGRTPPALERTAIDCGYSHVLISRPGRVGDNEVTLNRLAVTKSLDLTKLADWLHQRNGAIFRLQVRYSVLDLAKRAFGDDAYRNIRKRLLGTPDA